MNIVAAVTRAIEEDAQDIWFIYVRGGSAHALHVETSGPDGWDHRNYKRLSRGGESKRMQLARVERHDGTLRPWLLEWVKTDSYEGPNRRLGTRRGPEHRMDQFGFLPAAEATA